MFGKKSLAGSNCRSTLKYEDKTRQNSLSFTTTGTLRRNPFGRGTLHRSKLWSSLTVFESARCHPCTCNLIHVHGWD